MRAASSLCHHNTERFYSPNAIPTQWPFVHAKSENSRKVHSGAGQEGANHSLLEQYLSFASLRREASPLLTTKGVHDAWQVHSCFDVGMFANFVEVQSSIVWQGKIDGI